MSTLNVTGSSVVSTTLPAALVEAAYKLQIAESALQINPNNINISANDDTKLIAVSGSLPILQGFDADGDIVTAASNYTSTAVTAGGDIKATHAAALLLEMLQKVVDAEDAEATADPDFNPVTSLSINANSQRAIFETQIPFTTSLVSGKPTMSPTDYLS